MLDCNINSIYAEVRQFAEGFGNLGSFAYIETKGFQATCFRAEHPYSLMILEQACGDPFTTFTSSK